MYTDEYPKLRSIDGAILYDTRYRRSGGLGSIDMLATDIADHLVINGVSFRETHHIAGSVVRKAQGLKAVENGYRG